MFYSLSHIYIDIMLKYCTCTSGDKIDVCTRITCSKPKHGKQPKNSR